MTCTAILEEFDENDFPSIYEIWMENTKKSLKQI